MKYADKADENMFEFAPLPDDYTTNDELITVEAQSYITYKNMGAWNRIIEHIERDELDLLMAKAPKEFFEETKKIMCKFFEIILQLNRIMRPCTRIIKHCQIGYNKAQWSYMRLDGWNITPMVSLQK